MHHIQRLLPLLLAQVHISRTFPQHLSSVPRFGFSSSRQQKRVDHNPKHTLASASLHAAGLIHQLQSRHPRSGTGPRSGSPHSDALGPAILVECNVHSCANNLGQRGKHTRVQFNQTKQPVCKHTLRRFFRPTVRPDFLTSLSSEIRGSFSCVTMMFFPSSNCQCP